MSKRRPPSPSPFGSPTPRGNISSTTTTSLVTYSGMTRVDSGKSFKTFGPWEEASTANIRPKPKRRRESQLEAPQPHKPGLQLSGCQLQTPADQDVAIVKDALLFPTTLAVIRPSWPFCFNINCTPQLGPAIPEHVAEDLYKKYVCSSPLLRPGRLPYMHIGTTNLGFCLNFYLILPNAGAIPHAMNTGHLSDEALQLLFDQCIVPALQIADPKRQGFTSWMQAMNESNLNPLKARTTSSGPEMQEERIHCVLLDTIWNAIDTCDEEEVRHLLDGKVLVAYGEAGRHNWHEGWKSGWSNFKKDWDAAVDVKYLNEESRVKVEMDLELDVQKSGEVVVEEGERMRLARERKRVRR